MRLNKIKFPYQEYHFEVLEIVRFEDYSGTFVVLSYRLLLSHWHWYPRALS